MEVGVVLGLLIMYAVEPVVWNLIAYKVLTPKTNRKIRVYIYFSIVLYVIILFKQVLDFARNTSSLAVTMMGILLFFLIYGFHLLYNDSLSKIISLIGILYLIATVGDMVAYCVGYTMFSNPAIYLRTLGVENLCLTVIGRMIETMLDFALLIVLSRNNQIAQFNFSDIKLLIPFVIMNIWLNIVSMVFIYYKHISIGTLALSSFFIIIQMTIVSMLIIYVLYCEIKRRNAEKKISNMELSEYKMAQATAEQLRQMRHDMANHMEIILQLANLERIGEMQEYIRGLYEDIEEAKPVYLVQDPIVSSVLRKYVELTKQKEILFDYTVTISKMYMEAQDSVSLLSNILNNAIEACEKIEDSEKRYIYFDIQYKGDYYLIVSENSFSIAPKQGYKGKLITTKEDKKNHGLGISIIKRIVKKYKGVVTFSCEEESFSIKIKMPYRGRKEVGVRDVNPSTNM